MTSPKYKIIIFHLDTCIYLIQCSVAMFITHNLLSSLYRQLQIEALRQVGLVVCGDTGTQKLLRYIQTTNTVIFNTMVMVLNQDVFNNWDKSGRSE